MAHSTLETIKQIEEAAGQIQAKYEKQLADYQAQLMAGLEEATGVFKQTLKAKVQDLQAHYDHEEAVAEARLAQTVERYATKSQAALNQHRLDLVKEIIDKVVNRFTAVEER